MDIYLIISLFVGIAFMFAIMTFCRKWIMIVEWKILLYSFLLAIVGFGSVKLMFYIENGTWKGLSFFGAVLFVPVFLFIPALILHEKWENLLDLSAPAICGMLAVMKLECIRSGCCIGRIIALKDSGVPIRFPSREVELMNALVLGVILILAIRKKEYQGRIYPLFMIIYGATRFIWNLFRDTEVFLLGMAAGNFWAIASSVIGAAWLAITMWWIKKMRAQDEVV